MKTLQLILIVVVLTSVSVSAQKKMNINTDSLQATNDTLNSKLLAEPLKLENQFKNEHPRWIDPDKKQFPLNHSKPLLSQNKRLLHNTERSNQMPVMKPGSQSNMPIMKPDSSIHYHLLIKRIERPHTNTFSIP